MPVKHSDELQAVLCSPAPIRIRIQLQILGPTPRRFTTITVGEFKAREVIDRVWICRIRCDRLFEITFGRDGVVLLACKRSEIVPRLGVARVAFQDLVEVVPGLFPVTFLNQHMAEVEWNDQVIRINRQTPQIKGSSAIPILMIFGLLSFVKERVNRFHIGMGKRQNLLSVQLGQTATSAGDHVIPVGTFQPQTGCPRVTG